MSRRGRSDWGEWGYSGPRLPANGIKAHTQRGKFGATWWAGRWIAALEQLVDSGRLSRGRSYARSGQVTKLDVGSDGVDARVQGSRPTPYTVTIRFRRLTDEEWAAACDTMAAQAIYAARLLSGEMPEQIEDAFREAGAPLFPAESKDLNTDCTCPDWSNPCKHVAAVFYLLGEQFDTDPFLMFLLRGRSKEQIMDALRSRRAAESPATDPGSDVPHSGSEASLPDDGAEIEEPVPLLSFPATDEDQAGHSPVDDFWSVPPSFSDVTLSFRAPPVDALAVKALGPLPLPNAAQDTAPTLEKVYRTIGDHALSLATGDTVPKSA